jgi:hypothetical protein
LPKGRSKTQARIDLLVKTGAFRKSDFPKDATGAYSSTARHRALRWDRAFRPYIKSSNYVLTRPRSKNIRRALGQVVPADLKGFRAPAVPVRTGSDSQGKAQKIERVKILDSKSVAVKVQGRTWILRKESPETLKTFAEDPRKYMGGLIDQYGRKVHYHLRVGRGVDPGSEFMTGQNIEARAEHWAGYQMTDQVVTPEGESVTRQQKLLDVYEGITVEIPDRRPSKKRSKKH